MPLLRGSMLHVHAAGPCFMFIHCLLLLHVHAACLCCMSLLNISPCCGSIIHVHSAFFFQFCTYLHAACPSCMSMSMPHILAAYSCFMSTLHVLAECSCFMSMRLVQAALPCCMSLLHVLHIPAACSCCMSMLHVHTHIHAACP
jgi:hypothetical protein